MRTITTIEGIPMGERTTIIIAVVIVLQEMWTEGKKQTTIHTTIEINKGTTIVTGIVVVMIDTEVRKLRK